MSTSPPTPPSQAPSSREQARAAREQAQAARELAREQADAARELAHASREQARRQAHAAREQARKEAHAARKEAHGAREQARAQARAARSSGPGPDSPALVWLRDEPGTRRPAHSRAQIAAAALEIADREGFGAVSMRRVAEELGAGTMTLYHYVRNKDELVTLMNDAVMGEVLVPEGELPTGWREALAMIARRSRASFQRHRWMLDRIGDAGGGPNMVRHFEQSVAAVASMPIDDAGRLEAITLVDDYVFGFCVREAIELTEVPEEGEEWDPFALEFFQRQLDSGELPHVAALVGDDVGEGTRRLFAILSAPGRFERGLETLLDGIAVGVERDRER